MNQPRTSQMFHYVQTHALVTNICPNSGNVWSLQHVSGFFSRSSVLGAGLHSLGHFSRTPRTSKQRDYAKKGQSQNNPTPMSRKEGRAEWIQNRPPGPGQMETLLCHFYPYLEKQKGGNRTNFIFFRYFRNSLRFQLKRKEFKLDYKKVLFHYFICKSVDFFSQEYTSL